MKPFSRIISGTMSWGDWGKKLSITQMQELIEKAVDIGIHTFDHADIYGGYTTEKSFGEAFKKSSLPREKVQFITKCGIQIPCEGRPVQVKHYDYTTSHIQASVDNSLKNLNTEYLDLLLLHRPSPLIDEKIINDIITKLQREGKVKEFGVSNFTSPQMDLIQQNMALAWNQIECSLTHEESMFNGTLDRMKIRGIGAMAWSPLGTYFKDNSFKKKRIKKVLLPLCQKYESSEDQILLAWLLYHPSKIYPVVGTTSLTRLKRAFEAIKIKLEISDWFLLLEASMGKPIP